MPQWATAYDWTLAESSQLFVESMPEIAQCTCHARFLSGLFILVPGRSLPPICGKQSFDCFVSNFKHILHRTCMAWDISNTWQLSSLSSSSYHHPIIIIPSSHHPHHTIILIIGHTSTVHHHGVSMHCTKAS